MDFIFIANAWGAAEDNPTSKHHVAIELVRRGHRVLWIEGAGLRRPNPAAAGDRRRMVARVKAAWRGVRRVREMPEQDQRPARPPALPGKDPACEMAPGGSAASRTDPGDGSPGISDAGTAQGGLWVQSPLFIPLPSSRWIRYVNGTMCRVLALRSARKLGFLQPILVNFVVVFADAMRGWRAGAGAAQVIYYCVDRWDRFGTYDSALMEQLDADCCRAADLVVASSVDLADRCRQKNANTLFLPHGVAYRHFARAGEMAASAQGPARQPGMQCLAPVGPMTDRCRSLECGGLTPLSLPRDGVNQPRESAVKPAHSKTSIGDLQAGSSPRGCIGFFGLISEWVDQDLVVDVARAFPSETIVLYGKADVPVERLRKEPNIELRGPVGFAQLPAVVAGFRVGIIPFHVNELTAAVNPLKLLEMLAAGCPVVSTPLPEVERLKARVPAGGITVAGRAEFADAMKGVLRRDWSLEERRRLSESVRGDSWETRVDRLMDAIGDRESVR